MRLMVLAGATVEKVIGDGLKGSNLSFIRYPKFFTKVTLHFLDLSAEVHNRNIILITHEEECSSGWCKSTIADMEIQDIGSAAFGPMTHKAKSNNHFYLDLDEFTRLSSKDNAFKCSLFSYDKYGDDSWYPSGYFSVNYDDYLEAVRGFGELYPVWIFYGASNLGKTSLGEDLARSGREVFDTDAYDELPSKIVADIIVLGNRPRKEGKWTIENILSHLPDRTKPIMVNFSENK